LPIINNSKYLSIFFLILTSAFLYHVFTLFYNIDLEYLNLKTCGMTSFYRNINAFYSITLASISGNMIEFRREREIKRGRKKKTE